MPRYVTPALRDICDKLRAMGATGIHPSERERLLASRPPTWAFVLDASQLTDLDGSGVSGLRGLVESYRRAGIRVVFAGTRRSCLEAFGECCGQWMWKDEVGDATFNSMTFSFRRRLPPPCQQSGLGWITWWARSTL